MQVLLSCIYYLFGDPFSSYITWKLFSYVDWFYAGGNSVEAAVNWIVEHENDPDIDEMPLVNLCLDLFAGCLV